MYKKPKDIPNLKEYKELFLMDLEKARQTRYNYTRVLDLLIENFGSSYKLYDTNKGSVTNFKAFLLTRYKKSSVNRFIGYFNTIYNEFWETYANNIYKLDHSLFFTKGNPFKGARISKRELKCDRSESIVTEIELNKILSSIRLMNINNPEELHDIISVIYYLGLRRGEVLNIRKRDIRKHEIIIDGYKTGEYRKIPIFKEIAGILNRRKNITKDYLFEYSYSSVYHQFKKAVEKCKLDHNITLHLLRKSFGSNLIHKGVPLKKVSELMGHAHQSVTENYYLLDIPDQDNKYLIEQFN